MIYLAYTLLILIWHSSHLTLLDMIYEMLDNINYITGDTEIEYPQRTYVSTSTLGKFRNHRLAFLKNVVKNIRYINESILSLSLSLYIYIYTYTLSLSIYIYIYIYTHTRIYMCIYTHSPSLFLSPSVYICTRSLSLSLYIYIYIYIYTCSLSLSLSEFKPIKHRFKLTLHYILLVWRDIYI